MYAERGDWDKCLRTAERQVIGLRSRCRLVIALTTGCLMFFVDHNIIATHVVAGQRMCLFSFSNPSLSHFLVKISRMLHMLNSLFYSNLWNLHLLSNLYAAYFDVLCLTLCVYWFGD